MMQPIVSGRSIKGNRCLRLAISPLPAFTLRNFIIRQKEARYLQVIPELLKKMAFLRNFGHNGPEDFAEVGINGKNSEFHAAMGLVNLKYVDEILAYRKVQFALYDKWLRPTSLKHPKITDNAEFNHAYYPVVFPNEQLLLKTEKLLKITGYTRAGIFIQP